MSTSLHHHSSSFMQRLRLKTSSLIMLNMFSLETGGSLSTKTLFHVQPDPLRNLAFLIEIIMRRRLRKRRADVITMALWGVMAAISVQWCVDEEQKPGAVGACNWLYWFHPKFQDVKTSLTAKKIIFSVTSKSDESRPDRSHLAI